LSKRKCQEINPNLGDEKKQTNDLEKRELKDRSKIKCTRQSARWLPRQEQTQWRQQVQRPHTTPGRDSSKV